MPLRLFKNHLFSHSCVDLTAARAKSIENRSDDVIALGFKGGQIALGPCTTEDGPHVGSKKTEKPRSRSKEPKSRERKSSLKRSASDGYTKSRTVKQPKGNSAALKRSASDGYAKSMKIKPRVEAKPPKNRKATVKRSASDGHTKSKRIKPVPISVSANGHVRVMESVRSSSYMPNSIESSGSLEHSQKPIVGREIGFIRSRTHSLGSPTLDCASADGLAQNGAISCPLIKVDHVHSRPDSVSNDFVKIERLDTTDSSKRSQLLDTNTAIGHTSTGATAKDDTVKSHIPSSDMLPVSHGLTNTLNVGADDIDVKRHTTCLSDSRHVETPDQVKVARRKSSGPMLALSIAGGFLRRKNKNKPDEVHWKRKVKLMKVHIKKFYSMLIISHSGKA